MNVKVKNKDVLKQKTTQEATINVTHRDELYKEKAHQRQN